jgi:hypothetical protein
MTHITQPSNGGGLADHQMNFARPGRRNKHAHSGSSAESDGIYDVVLDFITVSAPTAPEIWPCNRSSEQPTAGTGVGADIAVTVIVVIRLFSPWKIT